MSVGPSHVLYIAGSWPTKSCLAWLFAGVNAKTGTGRTLGKPQKKRKKRGISNSLKSAERELNMQKRRRKKKTLKSVERALNTQKRRRKNKTIKSVERALNTQK